MNTNYYFLPGNVVADLNIKLLAASLSNKVDFLLIELADIDIVWDTKDYELKGVDPSVRGLVSPLVMAAQLERVSAHFEHVRNHSLEIRRYYRTVEY